MKIKNSFIITGLLLLIILAFSACTSENNKPVATENASKEITAVDPQFNGVLKSVDDEAGTAVFLDFNYCTDIVVAITGGTSIYNKDNSLITISSLEPGMIVSVVYDGTTMKAKKIQPLEDAWSYDNIINWSIDSNKSIFEIAGTKYRYNSDIVVLSQGIQQDIMNLNQVDELKVYGIDKKICSVIVEKGHGYIRPQNYKDFVGGTVMVGYISNQPVTEDMLLIVREGSYNVTMKNGNLTGTKTVDVKRDEESNLDMIEFKQSAENVGKVEFKIFPEGAEMYINGKQVEYDKAIQLNYGEHKVEVSLTGYSTYSGKLTVSSPNPTVKIDLTEEKVGIDEAASTPSESYSQQATAAPSASSQSASSQTSNDTSQSTTDDSKIVYDKEHKIIVNAPTGAEVYLNGTYKGKIPCEFPKQIGSNTITLSRDGFVTQSYSVTIIDDEQDITWSFKDLEAKN